MESNCTKHAERIASIETHILYIRDRIDAVLNKKASKTEVRIHRWIIAGMFTAMGMIIFKEVV